MTWIITNLRCEQIGDKLIVKRILWERDGKTGESEPHAYFNVPDIKEVTNGQIIEWIEAYIGQEALGDFANYVSPVLDPNSQGVLADVNPNQVDL